MGELPIDLGDLTLRRLRHTDFADMLAYYSHPAVARYCEWDAMTDEQVAAILEAQGSVLPGDVGVPLLIGIELAAEGRLIGDCSLTITLPEHRQAEIGFCLHPNFQRRGIAARAVHAVLGYAFDALGMHRIEARCDVRNERSCRLLERVGMRREGHLRQCVFLKDEWIDDYLYAVLESEWSSAMGEASADDAQVPGNR
jgi:RimJ/RimL family protein N-acetyltransferase